MSYKKQIMEEDLENSNCLGCEQYCTEEICGETVGWCLNGEVCMYVEEFEEYSDIL